MTVSAPPPATGHSAIGGAARISASVLQAVRAVPIFQPCLILVREGTKDLEAGTLSARLAPGGIVLLHAGTRPNIGNRPDAASGRYRALALTFGPQAGQTFRRHYPTLATRTPEAGAPWQIPEASETLADTVLHAAQGIGGGTLSERMACHRMVEVLAALAEQGVFLPSEAGDGLSLRIQVLVAARPHLPWSAADVARAFEISEATLRRRLAGEGTSFRAIVTEVRLTHGLILLQTGQASILEIALESGYESPSRFSARFRERFGMSPSEMRGER